MFIYHCLVVNTGFILTTNSPRTRCPGSNRNGEPERQIEVLVKKRPSVEAPCAPLMGVFVLLLLACEAGRASGDPAQNHPRLERTVWLHLKGVERAIPIGQVV